MVHEFVFFFVQKLITAQKYFSKKIPGFLFNLGFSSHHFKNSNNTLELEGDEYIVQKEVSKHFRWFDHTARHIKPHHFTEEELLKDFELNREFALVLSLLRCIYIYILHCLYYNTVRPRRISPFIENVIM